jgi:hypothetical protein
MGYYRLIVNTIAPFTIGAPPTEVFRRPSIGGCFSEDALQELRVGHDGGLDGEAVGFKRNNHVAELVERKS